MTLQEIKKLKTATEKLTKWETSGQAFGHFKYIESKPADKIYEFYCLMKIIEDLRTHYIISLIPGTRDKRVFPEAPANKIGWAYFKIINKNDSKNKFQICYGTNIKFSLAPLTTIAPDISIQTFDSTDDPDESMVELIMDAKYKYDKNTALPIEQIHSFIQRVNVLKTQSADTIPLLFNNLNDLKSNCLLTNGKALHNQLDYCIISKIKQISLFNHDSPTFTVVG